MVIFLGEGDLKKEAKMTGLELPGYIGIMKDQCSGCGVCMGCGSSWALVTLVAAAVYFVP